MVYKSGDSKRIDKVKKRFNITGDVYLVGDVMRNLESHKIEFPDSTASDIYEAEQEYITFLEEERQRQAELATKEFELTVEEPIEG